MTEAEINQAFNTYAKGKGIDVDGLSLSDFPHLLIDYHKDVEFTEVSRADDGDMLLFQYGTYDWGEGLFFEIDFTRQFYQFFTDTDDHEIIQQSFTFYLDPKDLDHVTSFNLWSNALESIEEFETMILKSEGYIEAVRRTPEKFEISVTDAC
jgi:hypothetical protein